MKPPQPAKLSPKASAKPPKGAKPVARITVYAVPKKGSGRKK
jgi:hypothetical protein